MSYADRADTVQRTIRYIEANLKENLSLPRIAGQVSFSEFHFLRLFQEFTGSTPMNYVRKRRLANAASELITTDRKILDIALDYRFESQEAFTRAFRKQFLLTPGRYRSYTSQMIHTRRHDRMNAIQEKPHGWILSGSHPHAYEIGVDPTQAHNGKQSGFLASLTDAPVEGFATLMQMFKSDKFRGQRLRLSGYVKTENVGQWAGMWMRVDGRDQEVLQFDNMQNRPLTGTLPWTHCQIVLDVPADSTAIAFGVLLGGSGRVWMDSLQFDAVDRSVPVTNLDAEPELPEEPMNLGFEMD